MKAKRMKTSEALRRTKARVRPAGMLGWDFGRFCCFAAQADGAQTARIVKPILLKLLHPYNSLEQWLQHTHGVGEYGTDKMQATRHAWLDHLIAHYESVGD